MTEPNPVPPRPAKTPGELVMPPVVYRVPGMENIQVRPNLKYTNADDPNLLMDVYTPPGEMPSPIVLCIHGAAGSQYKPKDWGIFQSWGRLIAASGMAAAVFTHRLGYPKPMLTKAGDDVHQAIEYVRAQAASWNVDPDRIGLMAWSGGGPLLTAAMREKPPYIRCLAAFYAFLDIQQSQPHRDHESWETLKAFSPISCLEVDASTMAPMFAARAGQDAIPGVNDSIDRFIAEAFTANAPVTLMNHPDGEHGFDNQNDDERSKEIIREALTFMRENLA